MPRRNSNARALFTSDYGAAWCQHIGWQLRQAPLTKQETPGTGIPEVSTAHTVHDNEVRAAGGQSDRHR